MSEYHRPPPLMGNRVYVQEGRFEQAMRKFKNKVQDSGLLNDLRDREAYEKPTTARKKAKAQAVKRQERRLKDESLPKKLY